MSVNKTIFFLKPLNDLARDVANSPRNHHLVSKDEHDNPIFEIGNISSKGGNNSLVTIGRAGDIVVDNETIARTQCSFDIDFTTGVIMLYDRSHNRTTQVFGENSAPFIPGIARKVVVQKDFNTAFRFGGEDSDLFQFEIGWNLSPGQTCVEVQRREDRLRKEDPSLAKTVDFDGNSDAATIEGETGFWPPQPLARNIRWAKIGLLGSGGYGTVYKAVEAYQGKLMAVKVLNRPEGKTDHAWRMELDSKLKREAVLHSQLRCDNIVEHISSQGWVEGNVEIFMQLKDGTLESLVEGENCPANQLELADTVLHQMLQAIDYLSMLGIVNRDVKPANILYVYRSGKPHFQLGDFGLSKYKDNTVSHAGTPLYMAPEAHTGINTHKSDVWSLYVTILWVIEARLLDLCRIPAWENVSRHIDSSPNAEFLLRIKDMGALSHVERASASDILNKCFGEHGLAQIGRQLFPGYYRSPTPGVTNHEGFVKDNVGTAEAGPSMPLLDVQMAYQDDGAGPSQVTVPANPGPLPGLGYGPVPTGMDLLRAINESYTVKARSPGIQQMDRLQQYQQQQYQQQQHQQLPDLRPPQ